ncbi:MAG: FkbM family methyltransferase, partial [Gemmatimonadaceae bacterium]|nr:FkbM family methyltransferase [Gemmatimonadaceae bacterium]
MIDVGANVGDTATLVAATSPDVRMLCVEGSARFAPMLVRNVGAHHVRAEIANTKVGDGAARSVSAVEGGGTGRLVSNDDSPARDTLPLDDLIASHPDFARPLLLKIYTDGDDFAVLRGAVRLIAAAEPILYVELHATLLEEAGERAEAMIAWLAEAGYR